MHVVFDASQRSPEQRAKQILDICAYELKPVSIGDQMTLETAIASEIRLALHDQVRILNETGVIPKKALHKAQMNGVGENHPKLLTIRPRRKET